MKDIYVIRLIKNIIVARVMLYTNGCLYILIIIIYAIIYIINLFQYGILKVKIFK